MNDKDRPTDDEKRLDAIVERLRSQPVPQMPPELLESKSNIDDRKNDLEFSKVSSSTMKRRTAWFAMATAIAAAVLAWVAIAVWHRPVEQAVEDDQTPGITAPVNQNRLVQETNEKNQVNGSEPKEGSVTVQNLLALQPFKGIEQEVEAMQEEVERLKAKAILLDAMRKAESMMARN